MREGVPSRRCTFEMLCSWLLWYYFIHISVLLQIQPCCASGKLSVDDVEHNSAADGKIPLCAVKPFEDTTQRLREPFETLWKWCSMKLAADRPSGDMVGAGVLSEMSLWWGG